MGRADVTGHTHGEIMRTFTPGRALLLTIIAALAASAQLWVLMLSPTEARRKAGLLSPHFWLRDL